MIFELWHSEDENSYTYIAKDAKYQNEIEKHKTITPDLELIWSYQAKSYFEAMEAYHKYLKLGSYKPEPDWENTVYEQ